MKHRFNLLIVLMVIASLALTACGGGATPAPAQQPAPEQPAQATEAPTAAPPAEAAAPVSADELPRKETLYYNGFQWGPVVGWNP